MSLENVIQNMYTKYIPMIGYPMDHSSASYVYNKLFNIYDINAIMWPLELEKGRLGEFMAAYKVMNIDKIALTMPHKADIIPFLDEVDECSRLFNSVNIVKTVDGKTIGSGFDGKGCTGALKAAGVQLEKANVMLLGAGSISGVVGYELSMCGVKNIYICNRTLEHAETVAKVLNENTTAHVEAYESTPENLDAVAQKVSVFINVRPLGMHGFGVEPPYLGFIEKLPKDAWVLDAIVNPPVTPVIAKARECGLHTILGMDMMISQMSEIFYFWYGVRPGPEEKRECKKILFEHFGVTEPLD